MFASLIELHFSYNQTLQLATISRTDSNLILKIRSKDSSVLFRVSGIWYLNVLWRFWPLFPIGVWPFFFWLTVRKRYSVCWRHTCNCNRSYKLHQTSKQSHRFLNYRKMLFFRKAICFTHQHGKRWTIMTIKIKLYKFICMGDNI